MSYKQASAIRGFSDAPNYYGGAAGQLPGNDDFSAMAIFRVNSLFGHTVDDQVIWGNFDGASGWAILLAANGVLTAVSRDATPATVLSSFDISTMNYVGKLIYVALCVTGGNQILYVQGFPRDTDALANPFVPGVAEPRVGISQVPDDQAAELDIIGVAYNGNGAFDDQGISEHFISCVEANDMVDPGLPFAEPSIPNGSLSNVWSAKNLINPANRGVLEIGMGEEELDAYPLPLATWRDSRDPAVYQSTPTSAANVPLISLAATGFDIPLNGVGVVSIPNPQWM